ncbi:DUF429 domain-containing protein [Pararhizobium mangrovi]|uniref:DUF429 domain-containing protein n=1 Tax=Pararhizobium mangrovi TaxID=2590452 RepID=A0A506U0F4_9HYPH|nr:DUF429 domain-containing protein [Pararhizobium mangrovi]TPW26069.1 DUF429 domain-containing protein [Pararhizobium mangrovi]
MSERVVAGVDGCRGGWIAVVRRPGEAPAIAVLASFAALLADLPEDAVVAVDMPIGLPETSGPRGRAPERAVRPLLSGRQSSVFSIPSRSAVYAPDYQEARRLALATSSPPKSVAKQAFHIFPRIRELDGILVANPALAERVIEVHPELAFWRLNGERAMALAKKVRNRASEPGLAERVALLERCGYERAFLEAEPPRGAGRDDVLDAAVAALVAERHAEGKARPFPDPFDRDAFGLPMAIWA